MYDIVLNNSFKRKSSANKQNFVYREKMLERIDEFLNAWGVHAHTVSLIHVLSYLRFISVNSVKGVCQLDLPVRIQIRIGPPYPHACRNKRRLNGAVLRMRPEKPRSRVTACVAR
jgi:hypothetical protein